nr:MAG: ORF1 [Torque teno midi virus]
MPFWWRRRRKPWYGRWKRRRPQRYKRRRTRRRFPRRRNRKTYRRRRRRKTKVRRKRAKLPVQQWQPDSIRKCKIKGIGLLVLGAEGTQMYCYTTNRNDYVPPKVPYGGGFGAEQYTLKYLYEEYTLHNNIWTHTNLYKDLCRYLWCKIIFYRHQNIDFITSYSRQPPFDINKWTYPACHPQQQLLQKHKKIILSLKSKPNGKYTKKMFIKPPKQMLSKWFFTKTFCEFPLFFLKGAALNLRFSFLTQTNENLLVNLISLNTGFYKLPNWMERQTSSGYLPYPNISSTLQYKYKVKGGTEQTASISEGITTDYSKSVNYDTGWFKPQFLQSTQILQSGTILATHATIAGRYNPTVDTGEKNKIYLVSTYSHDWNPPTTDKQILITGVPLWLGLYGFYSYIRTVKPKDYFRTHVVVLESPAIYCFPEIGSCTKYIPIDLEYIQGKKPYERPVTTADKNLWVPTMEWQIKTLNAIVESGPFVPNLSEERESSWELKYHYNFYFKWGGPEMPDQEVKNPQDFSIYNVPDTMPKTVQITNPEKQSTESYIHPWDIRRGVIKESALKRMFQHLETDTEFEYSTEEAPQKKKKRLGAALRDPQEETKEIQDCLLSLCEENTCQEQETKTLQQLIQQQQQQQDQLKYNILRLLMDLKDKQRMLQLQTGMLE